MKKTISNLTAIAFMIAAALTFSSCTESSEDDIVIPEATYELRVLTFEDADYAGVGNYLGELNWSSLIDTAEYGGAMLYGDYGWGDTDYNWYDEGNTELSSTCITSWGTTNFGAGGHAVSNYVLADYDGTGYFNQLSVSCIDSETGFGGYEGSENFCVHHGYVDTSSAGVDCTALSFGDGAARVVDHMYVVATSYLANYVMGGTDSYSSFGADDYLKIIATGYNGDTETTELTFTVAEGLSFVSEWTMWDLSSLGEVTRIELNMEGSDIGDWGLNTPAYFAFDNVAVRFDL